MTLFVSVVLAKQAEKKASLEQLQQGKKNKNKRKTAPNGTEMEPPRKRSLPISATPSPLLFTSRPDSVLSLVSGTDTINGEDTADHVDVQSVSEINNDIPQVGNTQSRTKKRGNTQRGVSKGKKSSAPLGGRGRIQRTGKKATGSAAASAGAIAGAIAANNAAYAAYGGIGYTVSPVPSHSLGGSPGSALTSAHGSSTQSSPRTSPGPPAFVATSLMAAPKNTKGLGTQS